MGNRNVQIIIVLTSISKDTVGLKYNNLKYATSKIVFVTMPV